MEPGLEANLPGRLNSPTILGHTHLKRRLTKNANCGMISAVRGRGVAWFNTPACQAGDRGFKSRRPRT